MSSDDAHGFVFTSAALVHWSVGLCIKLYFSGEVRNMSFQGRPWARKNFLFYHFSFSQRKTISGDNRIPCTDLQKTKKKKAANKMEKSWWRPKKRSSRGSFSQKCVVFYETNVKKGFYHSKKGVLLDGHMAKNINKFVITKLLSLLLSFKLCRVKDLRGL